MNSARRRYRARWLLPISGPPIENGTIEVGDGLITDVSGRADSAAEDLGDVAILPALVNCHTHLEFSDCAAPLSPAAPFTAWIRQVVAHRHSRSESPQTLITRGLTEATRAGTGLLGEIATSDEPIPPAYAQPGFAGSVIFREILGFLPEQIATQLEIARNHITAIGQASATEPITTSRVRAGLSPHAPYSVHPDLFRATVELARQQRVPVAMHLAETEAELELLETGGGLFREMLEQFGIWRDDILPRGSRPLDYLRELAAVDHALVVHGNWLSDEEIDFIARHPNLTVVYCPRTHAFFGHPPHPWHKLLAAGANVALGTDSRASNPDLSLWGEMQYLHQQFPDVAPELLLELGTLRGARALGLADKCGSLEVGKRADLAVVALPQCGAGVPWSSLLTEESRIIATISGGNRVEQPTVPGD